MKRLKLFFFFAAMSWLCLFRPDEGDDMIDCAQAGAEGRVRARVKAEIHRNGAVRAAPNAAGWLLWAMLGVVLAGSWVVWLVVRAVA